MATVNGSAVSETLAGGLANDTINGNGGSDTIHGGGGSDYITALGAASFIYADLYPNPPQDQGDGGNDYVRVGSSGWVVAGAGNDSIVGDGSDTLYGGAGNDYLNASEGINLFHGGLGADTIRGTGVVWTDDGISPLEGGDRVELSISTRNAHGVYDIKDFKAGIGGDVLSLQTVLAELTSTGFDGRNPLLDYAQLLIDGTRVVNASNSWLRLVQSGADVSVEFDATGHGNGSAYTPIAILRNVALSSLAAANFDPPFNFDGSIVHSGMTGSAGNDTLIALDGNDTLSGLAGNDVIRAGYGEDTLSGGDGNDYLYGGAGNDTLSGDSGVDYLYGEAGNDLLLGGSGGIKQLDGGAGNDTLLGDIANDVLSGGTGNDSLEGGAGNDYMTGSDGDDTLMGGAGADGLYGGANDDLLASGVTGISFGASRGSATYTIIADTGGDILNGDAGNDTLIGSDHADQLAGGEGANDIYGNGGNDIITGELSNWIDAGAGDDVITTGASSTVKGGAGNDRITAASNVNDLDGGPGDDVISGPGVLTGGSGNDVFVLNIADTSLFGPYQITDFVFGGSEDTLDLYAVFQSLREAGFDGSGINNWIRVVADGADAQLQVDETGPSDGTAFNTIAVMQGQGGAVASLAGADFSPWVGLNGQPLAASINQTVNLTLLDHYNAYVGRDGNDTLIGNGDGRALDGGFGNDSLVGTLATDLLFGYFGADVLIGGGASDFLAGGAGNDYLVGGDGDDRFGFVSYKGVSYSNYALLGEEGNDTIDGGDGVDWIDGGSGNDSILGGAGNDEIRLGDGADWASGDAGNDDLTLDFDVYADTVYGGAGNDNIRVYAGDYADGGADDDVIRAPSNGVTLLGGSGADLLEFASNSSVSGGEGNDRLHNVSYGSSVASNDTVSGGTGDDQVTLVGGMNVVDLGDGADVLDLDPEFRGGASGTVTLGLGVDTIKPSLIWVQNGGAAPVVTDFVVGAGGDRIDITSALARLNQTAGYDFSNPFTNGWMQIVQDGADAKLQVDLTGASNGGQWLTLVTLQNVTALTFDTVANLVPAIGGGGFHLIGTAGNDVINASNGVAGQFPGDGNDTLEGLAGNDTLDGESGGDDSLVGGTGTDNLFGYSGNDTLIGDTADNSAQGASDFLAGGAGNDYLVGGDGDDRFGFVSYKGVSYSNYALLGEEGNDTIDGGDGVDWIDGGSGNDSILGGAGNDEIRLGDGADWASGDAGNDDLTLDFDVYADTVYGGAGNDNIRVYAGDYADGGADDDVIRAPSNGVTLLGGSGADLLEFASNSSVSGGEGNDRLHNVSYGSSVASNDTVSGGTGDDQVTLVGGMNVVDLGDGADVLDLDPEFRNGASGTVTLGLGVDTIKPSLIWVQNGGAAPVVTDFVVGAGGDRIDITSALARLNQTAGYDFSNPFTNGWMQIVQDGADAKLQVDLTGASNGGQWLTLVTLQNVTASGFYTNPDAYQNFLPEVAPSGLAAPVVWTGTLAAELALGRDGADILDGAGGNDTLDGGFGGDDSLVGGTGTDNLFGYSGNDTLIGDTADNSAQGASDFLAGGAGNDYLVGGDGDDRFGFVSYKGVSYSNYALLGEEGNDTIDGGDGVDWIDGGSGNDSILGGAGNDEIRLGDGADWASGDAGNDDLTLDFDVYADTVYGGAGNDNIRVYAGDYADGGADDDVIRAPSNGVTLLGGSGADLLEFASNSSVSGGEGNDRLHNVSYGSSVASNDTVSGGTGDDQVTLVGGMNVVDLGDGADVLDLDPEFRNGASGTVTLGLGVDTIKPSLIWVQNGGAAPVVTDFVVGAGGDRIDITSALARLNQTAGYDFSNPFTNGWMQIVQDGADAKLQVDLTGASNGGQWLTLVTLQNVTASGFYTNPDAYQNFLPEVAPSGLAAPVVWTGTLAAELALGRDGADILDGAGGNDTLDGGFGGDDSLVGGTGTDNLFGYSGNDTLIGDTADNSAQGASDFLAGGAGNDYLVGGDGDDRFGFVSYKGVSYSNYALLGEEGNDTIDGGDGVDWIDGGSGNDSILGGAGNDEIRLGDGADWASGDAGNDDLTSDFDVYADTVYGGAGNDNIRVYAGDYADGGADDDVIRAPSNGVTLLGGSGADLLEFASNSSVSGGEGNDRLHNVSYGSSVASNDTVSGGTGDDQVTLVGGMNVVDLGDGADVLDLDPEFRNGASGTVTLGLGVDTIKPSLFWVQNGGAAPVVTDFVVGAGGDRIDISGITARLQTLGLGNGADPFAANWMRVSELGTSATVEVDLSGPGNGAQFIPVIWLQNVAAAGLTSANILQAFAPVASGNDVPQIDAEKTLIPLEDSGATALGLNAPVDPDGGSVTITARVLPAGTVKLAGGATVTTNQVLSGADLAGLTYTPSLNFNGDAGVFRYTVADEEGSIVTGAVNFTVQSVNDTPTVSAIPGQTFYDDGVTPYQISLGNYFSDVETPYASLFYTVTQANGDPLPSWLTLSGMTLSGMAPIGTTGSWALRATAADAGALSVYTDFSLNPGTRNFSGGSGNDSYLGASGNDTLSGSSGNDTLSGAAGNDTLSGGAGNDSLLGGAGADTLDGGSENDSLDGGAGNDTLLGGLGADIIAGSGDNDWLAGDDGNDTLDGGAGDDQLRVGGGHDYLSGGVGADYLAGGTGNDTLDGGAGNDTLVGSVGADVYVVDAGDVLLNSAVHEVWRVSVAGDGTQQNGAAGANPDLSDDGRLVVFASAANNLAGSDTNSQTDIFIKDLETGLVARVSTNAAGIQVNGASANPVLSADGRYVAFESAASNLVTGDTNGWNDVFVKDRLTGAVTRVSTDSAGLQSSGGSSYFPSISANGRYVAFESLATNLVAGDTNGVVDIFLKDLQTGATTRVSVSSSGTQSTSLSLWSEVSADGRYVTFQSLSGNLVAGDTNSNWDIFVRDTQASTTTRLSVNTAGSQLGGDSYTPMLSADATKVVFMSGDSSLVGSDTNAAYDVFVKDLTNGTVSRVSTDALGAQANGASFAPVVSGDFRFVAFHSVASNLVSGDTNGVSDVFVKDLQTGAIARLSADSDGIQTNGASDSVTISADGRFISFKSAGTTLAAGDNNSVEDIFVAVNPLADAGGGDVVLAADSYTLPLPFQTLRLIGVAPINGTGNSVDNNLSGNAGDNMLSGAAGADIIAGGPGNDTYVVENPGDQVMELGQSGVDTVQSAVAFNLMQAWHVENLLLTGGSNVNGSGNWLDNSVAGNSGVNILDGNHGNDTLNGAGGSDTLIGGAGDDVLVWDATDGSLQGGSGTDTLRIDGSGVTLDLTAIANGRITDVEIIDLNGLGNNTVNLNVDDVLAISSSTDALRIDGNLGDIFTLADAPNWIFHGIDTSFGATDYGRYTNDTATLYVHEAMLV